MAYVLGFFVADGCMNKNKRGACFLQFTSKDRDIIQKIRDVLASTHKIAAVQEAKEWKTAYRLQIGSKKLFNDLLKLGLVPRKAKRISVPQIPQKYLQHFIRGYFDGDGHVTVSTYKRKNRNNRLTTIILSGFSSSNKKFLVSLHGLLKQYAGLVGGSIFESSGQRLLYSIHDSLALYRFLYQGDIGDLYLSRKKSKFEQYLKRA